MSLTPDLASVQRYDIKVVLEMPRTPTNTDTGNFMLDAKMYAPAEKGQGRQGQGPLASLQDKLLPEYSPSGRDARTGLLAHSRRPAILTYYSPHVDLIQKATQLHWYILGWRNEAETLVIDLFESVEFAKGWRNVPSTLRLEVQSTTRAQMQIYKAKVLFRARFHGLRWLMYNYRVFSAAVFILSFWGTEVVFTGLAWIALSYFLFKDTNSNNNNTDDNGSSASRFLGIKSENGKQSSQSRIKSEAVEGEDDEEEETDVQISDTERSFPTYGSTQPRLHYRHPIKKEEEEEEDEQQHQDEEREGQDPQNRNHNNRLLLDQIPPIPRSAAEAADDEDEDEDADFVLDGNEGRWIDSGLGTSMESSAGGGGAGGGAGKRGPGRDGGVRRRRSRSSR